MKAFHAAALILIVVSGCKERLRACDLEVLCDEASFCDAEGICVAYADAEGIARFAINDQVESEIALSAGPVSIDWIAASDSACTLARDGDIIFEGNAVEHYESEVELQPHEWTLNCVSAEENNSQTINTFPLNGSPFALTVNGVLIDHDDTYLHVFGTDQDKLLIETTAGFSCSLDGADFSESIEWPCNDVTCARDFEVACTNEGDASSRSFSVQTLALTGLISDTSTLVIENQTFVEPTFNLISEGNGDSCRVAFSFVDAESLERELDDLTAVRTTEVGGVLEASAICASSSGDSVTGPMKASMRVVAVNEVPDAQIVLVGGAAVDINWDISGIDRCVIGGETFAGEENRSGHFLVTSDDNLSLTCSTGEHVMAFDIEVAAEITIESIRFYFADNNAFSVEVQTSPRESECLIERGNGTVQNVNETIANALDGEEALVFRCTTPSGDTSAVENRRLFWGTQAPDNPAGIHGIETVVANPGDDYSALEIAVSVNIDGSELDDEFVLPFLAEVRDRFRLSNTNLSLVSVPRLTRVGNFEAVRNDQLEVLDVRSLQRSPSMRINNNANLCQLSVDAIRSELENLPDGLSEQNDGICTAADEECLNDDDCYGGTRCNLDLELGVNRCVVL